MTRQVPGAPAASFSTAYHRVSDWLQSDFPEIQAIGRLWIVRKAVRHEDIEAQQPVGFADREFFRVFA